LEKRSPTQEQGARILRLLLWPKVATRSAYPIGRKPAVSIAIPFHLHFPHGMTLEQDVFANGQDLPKPDQMLFYDRSTIPQVVVSPVARDKVGRLGMEIRHRYILNPPPLDRSFYFVNPVGSFLYRLFARMRVQPAMSLPESEWYQVSFSVPVEVNVTEEADAEQVQLLSSRELDGRVRAAFTSLEQRRTPSGCHMLHILGKRLPIDMAFRCVLELPDGIRLASRRPEYQELRAYAGRDFAVDLAVGAFAAEEHGAYDAKLMLIPDPNCAFEEPTIKAIWNGTLAFPIHLAATQEQERSE